MATRRKTPIRGTISNDHYAAIGRAADKWADLEFEVDRTIWNLLRVKHAFGACVTGQLYFLNNKMRALIALVNLYELSEGIPRELNQLSQKMSPLIERRNRAIHDKRFVIAGTFDVVLWAGVAPCSLRNWTSTYWTSSSGITST